MLVPRHHLHTYFERLMIVDDCVEFHANRVYSSNELSWFQLRAQSMKAVDVAEQNGDVVEGLQQCNMALVYSSCPMSAQCAF